jgi:hypothetical protein
VIDAPAAEEAVCRYLDMDIDSVTELVQKWCRKARAPQFTDPAAREMAGIVGEALGYVGWRDEFASARETDPYTLRARRIAAALRILRADLPSYIEDWHLNTPPVPLQSTVALYELVLQHAPVMDGIQPRGRGRSRSMERDFSTFVAQRAMELWDGKAEMQVADAFANEALSWIKGSAPVSDDAMRKARTRRK